MVGEIPVNRFALGAATGTCAASISAKATGCAGIRTPTVGNPAVTMSGTADNLGTTSVNGPGQNRSARMRAVSGHDEATRSIISRLLTCTMIGLVPGRPLTSNTRATATASSAFAPKPYTVSVGKATSLPLRSNSAAYFISSSDIPNCSMDLTGYSALRSAYSVRPRDGSGESAESTSICSPEFGATPGG